MIFVIFFLGVLLSQFYVFPSGIPQISHLLIALFSVIALLSVYNRKVEISYNIKRLLFILIAYFVYIALVNLYYTIKYSSSEFIVDIVYMGFNLMVFSSVILILENIKIRDSALKGVLFSIITLLTLCIIGVGRFNYGSRFNAFFNDPNQMAYWSICVCVIALCLLRNNVLKIIIAVLCTVIIFYTQSRSGLIGVSILLIAALSTLKKRWFITTVAIIGVCAITSVSVVDNIDSDFSNRVRTTDINSQAETRGYNRIFKYQDSLIIGYGKGLENRFNTHNEIHSSWMSILFYYGVVGALIFSLFIFLILKNASFFHVMLISSPLMYGLSTYGLRTPIFWIMLAILAYTIDKNKRGIGGKSII